MRTLFVMSVAAAALVGGVGRAQAQAAIGFTADTFAGLGLSPNPSTGQLGEYIRVEGLSDDPAPPFGATLTAPGTDFTRGITVDGATTVGGLYAIHAGFVAVAVRPTDDDFTPGAITMVVSGFPGASMRRISLEPRLVYRNDTDRSTALRFAYSCDDVTYTGVPEMDLVTPATAELAGWRLFERGVEFRVPTGCGTRMYLRWSNDVTAGSGVRDWVGIDRVSGMIEMCDNEFPPCLPPPDTSCAAPAACDADAACSDVTGGRVCVCEAPCVGSGFSCDCPLGPCDTGAATCSAQATCSNDNSSPGGYRCTCNTGYQGNGMSCLPLCGDGLIIGGEDCDDDNIMVADGCSDACTVEVDWTCSGQPSICMQIGGADAGVVDAGIVDAATVDAGIIDAAIIDAGIIDAASVDAGIVDAGIVDTAGPDAPPPTDAAGPDAGLLDAAGADAAPTDGAGAGADAAADATNVAPGGDGGCDAGGPAGAALVGWLTLLCAALGRRRRTPR